MISVQKADSDYDSVDFEDFTSTLSHFKKLSRPSTTMSEEEIDNHYNEFMAKTIMKQTKKDPEKSAAEVELEVQDIFRLAAEKIHGAFRELQPDSIETTAEFLQLVVQEAWMKLFELLSDDDDNSSPKRALQLDPEPESSKEYEVIG